MNSEKSVGEKLKEELFLQNQNGWKKVQDSEEKIYGFSEEYKAFLNHAKTEREAAKGIIDMAKGAGFSQYEPSKKLKGGEKAFINNREKAVALIKAGRKPLGEGVRIIAAHIDSPRLDLKPNPVYEENELCYFKTHYYGGIRKYQWPSVPLALHGVVVKSNGEKVEIVIGEAESDPCFTVNDLLPHLAAEQSKKTLSEAFKGEDLNILIGSRPFKDDKVSEAVKLNILKLMSDKYGIREADFVSAELSAVPAFQAKDVGLDRSMVGAYGHDDRVCAFAAVKAVLDVKETEYTTIVILADKEETGSEGNTGLASDFLRNIVNDLAFADGINSWAVFEKSKCLSADVNCAFDPNFSSVFERRNSAYMNSGVAITKYTGAKGKSETNDASAEYMAFIRNLLDSAGIVWQTGELGAVDAGGGGTVAKYISNLSVDTVDLGVPVLSMHSPFEVISKLDLFMAYRAFVEFIK